MPPVKSRIKQKSNWIQSISLAIHTVEIYKSNPLQMTTGYTNFNCDMWNQKGKTISKINAHCAEKRRSNSFSTHLSIIYLCLWVASSLAVYRKLVLLFFFFVFSRFIGLKHCRWTKLLIHISTFFSDIN